MAGEPLALGTAEMTTLEVVVTVMMTAMRGGMIAQARTGGAHGMITAAVQMTCGAMIEVRILFGGWGCADPAAGKETKL